MHEIARLLRVHAEPIAKVLVQEIAKGVKDSVKEVVRSAELLAYCAEEGVRVLGSGEVLAADSSIGQSRNKLSMVHRVPLGVVLCIPPFNYPINLAVSKLGPALMAGNGVVFKPPTQGAAAGVLLTKVMDAAGIPKGLVNLMTGRGSEIGDYLTTHQGCSCISFTGGDTGLAIAQKARMIPLQMELGGKDVCIVCSDANLDLAAKHIVSGAFSYSGQRCTAVKIVLADSSIADTLLAKVNEKVATLTVGSPEDDADIGPVISEGSADFIQELAMDAKEKGAVFC